MIASPPNVLIFRLRHPSASAQSISDALAMKPDRSWTVGELRSTSKGRPLSGTYSDTRWSARILRPKGDVVKKMTSLVKRLQDKGEWMRSFHQGGGTIELYLQLTGGQNAGDIFPYVLLVALTELRIDLTIEVFPDMKTDS